MSNSELLDRVAVAISNVARKQWDKNKVRDDWHAYAKAAIVAAQLDELRAENERLKEVLTPSTDTKASYIGEFKFSVEMRHPRLGSEFRSVDVPWTTIKEIMAAIRSKALGGTNA
jgi:hypothetical protein